MAELPPPNLDLPVCREISAYDLRDMTPRRFQPLIRHVVMVLEGQCPLCLLPLGMAMRPLATPDWPDRWAPLEPRLVGRCDTCWLDFIASVETLEDHRHWSLEVCERDPPEDTLAPPTYTITDG